MIVDCMAVAYDCMTGLYIRTVYIWCLDDSMLSMRFTAMSLVVSAAECQCQRHRDRRKDSVDSRSLSSRGSDGNKTFPFITLFTSEPQSVPLSHLRVSLYSEAEALLTPEVYQSFATDLNLSSLI